MDEQPIDWANGTSGRAALVADRIVTGDGRKVLRDHAVVVSAGKIEAVVRRSEIAVDQTSLDVFELGDATLLPGLIDCHTHVTWPGNGSKHDEIAALSEEESVATMSSNIRKHRDAGVTTIRDNGSVGLTGLKIRDRLARNREVTARVLMSGPPLTPTDGHMHWCGGTADSAAELKSRVEQLASKGVDHIKLVGSGGGTKGTRQYETTYETELLRSAVQSAHEQGLQTAIHAHAVESIERAALASVDSIEHASFMVPNPGVHIEQHGTAWIGLKAEFDPVVAQLLLDAGSFVNLTLLGGYLSLLRLRAQVRSNKSVSEAEARALEASEEHRRRKLDIAGSLWSFGLRERIAVSTDAGPADNEFGRMAQTLELATHIGMSPLEAIGAVTGKAAELLGMSDRIGRVAKGLEADLMVVRGNPVEDVRALEEVQLVMIGGRTVRPGRVSRRLVEESRQ